MNARWVGLSLIAATTLFWLSWLLMPGVGITDAALILEIVAPRRSAVYVSSILQLVSAALYVPAILGALTFPQLRDRRGAFLSAGIFLLGAMGSAADAVYHLLAYAMTAPDTDTAAMVPVMQYMQGRGLALILPFIAAYFLGGYLFARQATQAGLAHKSIPWLYPAAIAAALIGAAFANATALTGRHIGLFTLFLISIAQAAIGTAIAQHPNPPCHPESASSG